MLWCRWRCRETGPPSPVHSEWERSSQKTRQASLKVRKDTPLAVMDTQPQSLRNDFQPISAVLQRWNCSWLPKYICMIKQGNFAALLAPTYCFSCTSVFQTSSSRNSQMSVALFPSCPCLSAPRTWSCRTDRGITKWIFNGQQRVGQVCSFWRWRLLMEA